MSDEKLPSLFTSPNCLHIEKLEDSDDTLEKPERPSPVSVLEPFFLEGISSPGSTTADQGNKLCGELS